MWGLLPIYFVLIAAATPTEVLAHRIVWAVPFGALIIFFRRQWAEAWQAFFHRETIAWLGLAAVCIAGNWFIYVWAVQHERIFDASLGYYINPLTYVLAGVVFFKERLRRLQLIAVVLAGVGVGVLTISVGELPWVSISLALLFTAYGVIRKRVVIGAMPGLFVETLLLFPFALAWLIWLMAGGQATFGATDTELSFLLILAGPLTVLPLLFFAVAARRLTLTTIGFMQFLAPTMQLGTGLYYGEQLTPAYLICFALIWAAIVFFSIDALKSAKKKPQLKESTGA
jgi:chloramphenicol-sensitive protein RarD